ncbi:hypothetical protein BDN70DRAFT_996693 [Pholiota conissans]|uniref:Uncharacterized protein n=1 Tax=Pholiota conissans TaxID=109636 RepID=A0A9P5YTV9_9AGAR|nr:hypothetical protein BDN70DRAFT_996693 [Pholiota conissans]
MSEVSVPDSVGILAAISANFRPFCEGTNANSSLQIDLPVPKQVANLLGALTFFFSTVPRDRGRVYAMTLATTAENIIATITVSDASQSQSHSDPSPLHCNAFPDTQDSPEAILTKIWGYMVKIATSSDDDSDRASDSVCDMASYLFRVNALQIHSRFRRWSKEFGFFWDAVSADMDVYQTSPEDEALGQGDWCYTGPVKSLKLRPYLQAAKAVFDCQQQFCSTGEVQALLAMGRYASSCRELEASLSIYDKGYLERTQRAAGIQGKGTFSYPPSTLTVDLGSSSRQKVAGSWAFKKLSGAALKIRRVISIPQVASTDSKSVFPPEVIAEFLRNAYVPSEYSFVESDIELAIKNRVHRARKKEIIFSPPHCECLLLRHHHLDGAPIPFPYIGVSKRTCFQCGMYLDAYNAYNAESSGLKFLTRGRRNDIIPCLLPSIDADIDSYIVGHMRDSIRRVVTAMLNEDIREIVDLRVSTHRL